MSPERSGVVISEHALRVSGRGNALGEKIGASERERDSVELHEFFSDSALHAFQ